MPSLRIVAATAAATGLLAAGAAPEQPAAAATPVSTAVPSQAPPAVSAQHGTGQHITFTRWRAHSFGRGTFEGTRRDGGLVIGASPAPVSYRDPYGSTGRVGYDRGRWYSPWVGQDFGLTELIASYDATTPPGTFIEVSVRGRTTAGRLASWDSLGRWASYDRHFHRMSLGPQPDDFSRVDVDTLVTNSGYAYASQQLRVTLMRRTGTARTPTVGMLSATGSRLPDVTPPTSRALPGAGRDLVVPRFSQEIHVGQYPRWNGGGEAWCSPTSTSMLVAYWDRGPTPEQYSWVRDSYRQPWVDYAARHTYASGYDGTGDWPFNTAYAAGFGLDAFVTRLRSLRQAELFIDAGIPLAASITFGAGQLDGAPISSSAGHLVVIRGFTDAARVIVNDPAARSARQVRRVYRRGQFERAWVGSAGGVAYVVHPAGTPLPDPGPGRAW